MQKSYWSGAVYAPQGALKQVTLGNALTERWSYNAQRLQPYDVRLGTAGNERSHLTLQFAYCANQYSGGSCATNNGNIIAQFNYANNHIEHYGYDAANRLTSATDYTAAPNGWSQGYSYDRYGNRWVSANDALPMDPRTPDSSAKINAANNRLTGANYGYDAAGNQTTYGGWTLAYDAENRLVSSEPSSGNTTTYDYDGEGRRVKKTTNGVSTVYVYGADGELAAEYGGPAQTTGTRYITTDHLGSTRLVTDSSGNVVSRHDYLPFGEEIPSGIGGRTAAMKYVANTALTQRFTGKERDTETGLDYFGARYLSGVLGRFVSPDPIWVKADRMLDPQRLNFYAYGRNNPLKFTDPTGMELQVGNCGIGETVTTCVEKLKRGLEKADRIAVSVIKGNGDNGCTKGAYCVGVDKGHKSSSENFKALEYVANKKGDIAVLEGKGANDRVSSFSFNIIPIAAQAGYEPTMNKETGYMGITLNPLSRTPGIPNPYMPYSPDRDSHVVFATGMSLEDIVTTMHHEIRHIFLGDFGRLTQGDHPQSDAQTTAAEREAERNLGAR